MIGSVIFYVFYPLSRFLSGRSPEASKEGPAVVNGEAVWDGGAAKSGKFTQPKTTLLEQWLSPTNGSKGETKERVKDPSVQEGNSTRSDMDEELLMAITSWRTEVRSEKEEEQSGRMHGAGQESPEASKQDDGEMTVHQKVKSMIQAEDESFSPAEEISSEQVLEAQLKCLQEATCLVQEQVQIQAMEEPVIPAENSTQETTSSAEEQSEISHLEKSGTLAEETECWDEYVVPAVDESHAQQTSWHFPAGPGLTKEVQCPLLQFPAMSYYPPMESLVPFEVTWRVWVDESVTSPEPGLIPFPFTKASMDFTVMSYNILAQDLLEENQELYTHCPLEVLEWNYRCSLLLEEMEKWCPDILCLQEVQENHYYEQLHPALSQMGYTCVYKRRTGPKTDGCATCYRSSRFSEIAVTELEFFRPETGLLDRHNVGIVLLLRPLVTQGSKVKEIGPPLCVANTHLLFNPGRGDVKLAQLAIMLAEIDRVIKSCKAKGEHCNIIMCGDFNSVPRMPLYQLITTGELYYQGMPAWMVSGQEDRSYKASCYRLFAPLWPSSLGITDNCQYTTVNEMFESKKSGKHHYSHNFMLQLRYCPAARVRPQGLMLIPGVTDNTPSDDSRANHFDDKRFRHTISHRLNLESVYKHILPGSGNPEVTTLHSEVGHTVDYIFYSPKRVFTSNQEAGDDFASDGLKLVGSLSLPSEDVLWSMQGLPNDLFPSDHLSLIAKFQLDISSA